MQIKSNKCLLNLISKHKVGIMYPNLIPRIIHNIVIQRDISIFNPEYYPDFLYWFYWAESREGHKYWARVNKTLRQVSNEDN